MQRCYEKLEDQSEIEESKLVFPSFDGNNEGEYMAYANFLRHKEDRFTYVKLGFDGMNSHAPLAGRYKRMIAEWQKVPSERRYDGLTKEEIVAILSV